MFMAAFACVTALDASPAASPKEVDIVDVSAAFAGRLDKIGNVKVSFTDGRTEVLTKDGCCLKPEVSPAGAVGWIHFRGLGGRDKDMLMNEVLQVRLPSGKTSEFKPESEEGDTLFIEKWGFADGGASVVMKTRSYHGPAGISKYDIKSGKITGNVNGASDELPKWAEPYSDDL